MSLNSGSPVPVASVVIAGGGFAGLKCALELAVHRNVRITLIDKNNYQQFHPLLYQVAASMLSPANAAFALRDIFRNHENVDVQLDKIVDIDLDRRTVRTASGNAHQGDYLVLATGSRVNYYGIRGAEEHSHPLYTLKDAEKLRSVILQAFEAADRAPGSAAAGALNFVVVGGGPTGVEMAGTLGDMLKEMLPREFRHVPPGLAKVFLLEAGSSVLSAFSVDSQRYAASALQHHGVQVRLGTPVAEVGSDEVVLSDGSRIPASTVIWAAGVTATALPSDSPLPKARSGRIEVNQDLTVRGLERVYAIGDIANSAGEDGKPLPQLAAVAQQAGKHCAANIVASLRQKPSQPFVYSDRGILAMVGRNAAVAELGKTHHQLSGPVAFVTWLGVHLALLTVARAKVEAIVEWAWEYFGGEHPGQLIDQ